MLLVVGLGNPGPEYGYNRHNVGYMAVDEIVRRHSLGRPRRRFKSETYEGRLGDDKVLAIKPLTYVNRSGEAVGEATRFYKLAPEQVVVIYDELDLAPGKVRARTGGGAAGHNGVRSITAHIGSNFRRVRIGIGHPGDKDLVAGYVLRDFSKADRSWIEPLLDAVAEALPLLVVGDEGGFMTKVALRTRRPSQKPGKPEKGATGPAAIDEG